MDLFSESEASLSRASSPQLDIVEQHSDTEDDSGGGDDDAAGLRINEDYAKRFQHNRERTELHQLEAKHGKHAAARKMSGLQNGAGAGGGGSSGSSSGSSSDESEDEEGEQMTADVDAAILATLAKIRRKDESIYDAGKRVFDEERQVASSSKLLPRKVSKGGVNKSKVTLGQYQRARIQELLKTADDPAKALADATMVKRRSDEQYGFDEIEDAEEEDNQDESMLLPFSKEQAMLRKEVTDAFHGGAAGEDEDGGDFFERKNGGKQDEAGPDDDPESYRRYLIDVLGGKDDDIRAIIKSQAEEAAAEAPQGSEAKRRKQSKVSPRDQEKDDDDFLANYVLNRGWVDNPSAAPKVGRRGEDNDGADSEGSFDSRADAYETAFNFRFQELEDGDVNPQIQSYARQIEGSARRKEEKRKREREERARRKEQEREEKKKQLDRMRDLKRKSIVDRLKALKEATGSSAVEFESLDLDKDFDPDEHDRLMSSAFNDDYYGENDDEKPEWSEDSDIEDILREQEQYDAQHDTKKASKSKSKSKVKGEEEKKPDAKSAKKAAAASAQIVDSGRIEMDADFMYENDEADGKKLSKAEKKKLKKRERAKARKAEESAGADGVPDEGYDGVNADEMDADAAKPEEPQDWQGLSREERQKKMESMMNEYYGLEYEDVIGDQPTRFKYAEVPRSDFGMTAEEILMADDADLNKVVGLKRLQPFRRGKTRPSDLNARLKEFRRNLDRKQAGKSSRGEGSGADDAMQKQKRPGKRERERKAKAKDAAAAASDAVNDEGLAEGEQRKGKRNAHGSADDNAVSATEESQREPPSRKKSKKHHKKQAEGEAVAAP